MQYSHSKYIACLDVKVMMSVNLHTLPTGALIGAVIRLAKHLALSHITRLNCEVY